MGEKSMAVEVEGIVAVSAMVLRGAMRAINSEKRSSVDAGVAEGIVRGRLVGGGASRACKKRMSVSSSSNQDRYAHP
jgi:hypothetical protein